MPMPSRTSSVSYTHLDVYKRQLLTFQDLSEQRVIERMRVDFVANASHESVSYTHLDVYKRQATAASSSATEKKLR